MIASVAAELLPAVLPMPRILFSTVAKLLAMTAPTASQPDLAP